MQRNTITGLWWVAWSISLLERDDIVTLWHDDIAPDQLCRGIATQGRYGDDGVDSGEKQDRKQDIFLYYS